MLTDVIVIYTHELCSLWKNRCSAGDVFHLSHYYHSIKPLTRATLDHSKSYKRTQTFLYRAKPPQRWKPNVYFWIHPSKHLLKAICHTHVTDFLMVTERSAIVAAFIPLSHRQMDLQLLTQQSCCSIDPYINLFYCQQQGAAKVYSGVSGPYWG